ncbi:MAG: ActS/PrrB/RegB family redox-sensitive histidine kinase [Thalassobaculales bacterium]
MDLLFASPLTSAPAAPRTVRLHSLVQLRWLALLGQVASVLVVAIGLGFSVPVLPFAVVLALTAAFNLCVGLCRPAGTLVGERSAALHLAFDLLQLSTLLYFSGGLLNPFSVLILAPVMVAASILSRRTTLALTLLAVLCVSTLALHSEPLPWAEGGFSAPALYVVGQWVAAVIALLFMAAFSWLMAEESRRLAAALAETQVALAREQRLSALGSLAAAAAHELGTPLGTIAIAAREMQHDLPPGSPLAEDVALIVGQTERCRRILAELSRRPDADRGPPDRQPVSLLIEQAAEGHRRDGVLLLVDREGEGPEPSLARTPELVHGLGNIIHNALGFARSAVEASVRWSATGLSVEIVDDGPGFPPELLHRLGEPYISTRTGVAGHMGLGIFIAKTLLARTGAELAFANDELGGARVTINWPRPAYEAVPEAEEK